MLHVAPEPKLARLLHDMGNIDYVSGDLDPAKAMVRLDATDIQFPDESFNVVYCSHVLEHVPEDRKAMSELYRVLKPGCWGILDVPIKRETTFEDPSVTTPEERLGVFGQSDHVRIYGEDYVDRLKDAGFDVTVERFADEIGEENRTYYGLPKNENIYLCRK